MSFFLQYIQSVSKDRHKWYGRLLHIKKNPTLQSGAYLYIWGQGVKINAPTQAGYKKAKEKFEKRYIFYILH